MSNIHYLPQFLLRTLMKSAYFEVKNYASNSEGWQGELTCNMNGNKYMIFIEPVKEETQYSDLMVDDVIEEGGF